MKILILVRLFLMLLASAVRRRKIPRFVNMRALRASSDVSVPPAGLSRHVKTMMIEGLTYWQGTPGEKEHAAEKLTSTLL